MRRLIAAALMLACALHVQADTRTLRVVLFDIQPYAMSVDGKPQGLYVDWMRSFLGTLGIQPEFQLKPFARIASTLEQREADLTISFATEALASTAVALGPVLRVDSVVVMKTGWPSPTVPGLQGAQIGRARGGCLDLAQQPGLELRWTEINGFDKGLLMLERGRLDGVCLTRDVLRHQLPQLGIDRSRLGPEIVVGHRVATLFARRTLEPAVLAPLQAALALRPPMQRD